MSIFSSIKCNTCNRTRIKNKRDGNIVSIVLGEGWKKIPIRNEDGKQISVGIACPKCLKVNPSLEADGITKQEEDQSIHP